MVANSNGSLTSQKIEYETRLDCEIGRDNFVRAYSGLRKMRIYIDLQCVKK